MTGRAYAIESRDHLINLLCRCGTSSESGGSSNKPNCDGRHAKIGFQAD